MLPESVKVTDGMVTMQADKQGEIVSYPRIKCLVSVGRVAEC